MGELLQFTITGLSLGVIYSLIALGFVVVWKSSGVANLALGQLVLISSWFSYSVLVQAGLAPYIGLPLVIIFALILGWLIERVVLRPLIAQPILSLIAVTLGLGYFLQGLVGIHLAEKSGIFAASFPQSNPAHRLCGDNARISVGDGDCSDIIRSVIFIFPL